LSFWDWLFHRRRRDEELDEEVQAHLRMAAQERMEQGETAEQARAQAVPNPDVAATGVRETPRLPLPWRAPWAYGWRQERGSCSISCSRPVLDSD
jgi:outer membrane protein TolC